MAILVNPRDADRAREFYAGLLAPGEDVTVDPYKPPGSVWLTDEHFERADDQFMEAFAEAQREWQAHVASLLAAQQAGATTDPAVVHDATAEVIPFWVSSGERP